MATMRELKGRIDSVHSSQKITGAMKMISSARLRKAESKLAHSQPYREKLWEIYHHIMNAGCDYESPLTRTREVKRVALVVFASDEGLCGGFNINVYKELREVIREYRKKGVREISVWPVGKKIQYDVHRMSGILIEEVNHLFEGKKDFSGATKTVAERLVDQFLTGKIDRADVIYTHYKSIGTQIVMNQRFLPVRQEEKQETPEDHEMTWYIYEPDCAAILQTLYPLILHAQIYQALMESRTSEQAARILAMQMANDNANKLLGNLHLEYNKLRQQGITSELLDIAGGTVR